MKRVKTCKNGRSRLQPLFAPTLSNRCCLFKQLMFEMRAKQTRVSFTVFSCLQEALLLLPPPPGEKKIKYRVFIFTARILNRSRSKTGSTRRRVCKPRFIAAHSGVHCSVPRSDQLIFAYYSSKLV